jgi:alkylhydroperoxidase/carboxymuconolactone decarboxylase family protein YurZ
MRKIICLMMFSFLLVGCGSSKPVPEWTDASFNQLDNYKKSYLSGKERIAEAYFDKAVDEIKSSGDLDILARAYLTKYAVQVAVLEAFDEGEYLRIEAVEPVLQNKNFYGFLKGAFDNVDENQLPQQYEGFLRAFKSGKKETIAREISKMDNSLSKLIAIGLLVKKNKDDEIDLKLAIDIASQNGWKKALLAYLGKLQSFYEANKEPDKAAHVEERIKLIKN